MTVLLLSLMDAVMRPGVHPLLHSASFILLSSVLLSEAFLASLRSRCSSRNHLYQAKMLLQPFTEAILICDAWQHASLQSCDPKISTATGDGKQA